MNSEVQRFLLASQAAMASARPHLLRAISHFERSERPDLRNQIRRLHQLAGTLSELEGSFAAAGAEEVTDE